MDVKQITAVAAAGAMPSFADISMASNAIVEALAEDVVLTVGDAIALVCALVDVPVLDRGRMNA